MLSTAGWADKLVDNTDVYFFLSRTKAIKDIPLLTTKSDTMYRYYKHLEKEGFIVLKKIENKDYVKFTSKCSTWNGFGQTSECSDKFPNDLGQTSESNSDKFPTYKYTSIDKYTNDNITENKFSVLEEEKVNQQQPKNSEEKKEEKSCAKKEEKALMKNPTATGIKSEVYAPSVEYWLKEFHPGWSFGGQQGKALKSIISKLYDFLKFHDNEITSDVLYRTFKAMLSKLPEYYKNKDLSVLDSKFNEIITEIIEQKNGNTTKKSNNPWDQHAKSFFSSN